MRAPASFTPPHVPGSALVADLQRDAVAASFTIAGVPHFLRPRASVLVNIVDFYASPTIVTSSGAPSAELETARNSLERRRRLILVGTPNYALMTARTARNASHSSGRAILRKSLYKPKGGRENASRPFALPGSFRVRRCHTFKGAV